MFSFFRFFNDVFFRYLLILLSAFGHLTVEKSMKADELQRDGQRKNCENDNNMNGLSLTTSREIILDNKWTFYGILCRVVSPSLQSTISI